ncbi:MAG: T9SS type A sorting domain-containing protein [Saprospiraceae bacterium]|nr:T9SS type A sorting domain-containing protein [Saprospiraceae bacterium]
MTRSSRYRSSAVIVGVLLLGLFNHLSAQMMCPFPPPTAENVNVCEGESTLIDLSAQATVTYNQLSLVDFEMPGGYTTQPAEFSDGNEDFFTRTDGTNINSGQIVYSNIQGSFYFAAMDLDAEGGQEPDTVFIDPINIMSAGALDFSIFLAEDDDGSNQDWDAPDYLHVEYQIDGGGFQPLLWVENDGSAFNSAPFIDTDFDGDGDGDEITDVFSEFTASIPGSGANLDIRIIISLDSGDEDIAFDNILVREIIGMTTFNFYDADPNPGPATQLATMVTSFDPGTTVMSSPQSVWVTTTDGMCETIATEMTVTVTSGPVVLGSATDTELCVGDDIELMETGGEADSWSWTGPNGFTSVIQNPTIMGAALGDSGTYRVRGTNSMTGCTDSSDVVITVSEAPIVLPLETITACIGGSTLIDLSSLVGPASVEDCFLLDFEAEGGYTTDQPEFSDGGGDFFTRTDGSDIGGFVNYNNVQGSFFFAGMDLDGDGMNPGMVFIDGIDISGKSNLGVGIYLAEDDDGSSEDWDEPDFVHIDYQIDGGGYQPLLWIENDGSTFNSAPYIDTDFDGTGDGAEITDVFTNFITTIAGTGNTLDLRITVNLDSGDEDIAFDNITVGTYLPAVSSFNFYDMDPSGGGVIPVASMVTSYDPGMAGTYWVTGVNGGCEGAATTIDVVVSQGEQPLRCNDHINISLNAACSVVLTPEMFSEGDGVMYEFLEVQIMNAAGQIIPDATLTGAHVGGTYTVKIIDVCNGNSCWSSVTLEDKLGPVFPDFCPQDQPCPVECFTDIDDVIANVSGFLDGQVEDCTSVEILPPTYEWRKGTDCDVPDTLVLTFTAVDAHGNLSTKKYYYTYEPIEFTNIVYPGTFTGTCTTDPVPSLTRVPTVNGEDIVFSNGDDDTQICNILARYDDIVLPACDEACDNSRKIVREFTLLDWCSSNIDVGIQIIHLKDLERPVVNPFEMDEVSVDPWLCAVEIYQLPLMDAVDNCTPSDHLETIIQGPAGMHIELEPDGRYYVHDLPKGTHAFSYYAVDCCGNKSLVQPFIVEVYDGVAPVAIAKQFTVVSLSDDNNDDGIAKIFAESLDNGSYDNCSDVKLEIRRDGFFGRTGANDGDYTRWDSLLPPFVGFPGPYAQYPCDEIGNDTYNTDYDINGNPIVNGHSWDLPSGFNRQIDPDGGEYVKFCCYDVTAATVDVNNDNILDPGYVKVWLRVWDNANMSMDASGNPIYGDVVDGHADMYNETWGFVKVEIGTPPELNVENTTIGCDWPYAEKFQEGFFLEEYWVDNYIDVYGVCDVELTVTFNDDNVDQVCPGGYFELIYTATNVDPKQVSTTKVQRVYIENFNERMACEDINWPASYQEMTCLDSGSDPELTWNAAPCDLIGWTFRSDTFLFGSDACAKIINEYTLIDWCQWDWYYGQSGNDTQNPSMMNGSVGYFEGGHDYLDGTLCEEPGIDGTPDTRIPDNGVYKYVEIIKIIDTIPPEVAIKDDKMYPITNEDCFTYVTLSNTILDMTDYECPQSAFRWEVTIDWNNNGDFEDDTDHHYTVDRYGKTIRGMDLVFEVYDQSSTSYPKSLIPFEGPMVSYDVRYVVFDGCGNVGKEVINIMAVDKKPPTPYCVSLSSAVMENGTVELWARDFDRGSFDYCTDQEFLEFTFDGIAPVEELINVEHYFDEDGEVSDAAEIEERYNSGEIQKWNPDQLSSAKVFTCDDLPTTTFGMSVWDNKDNMDYCEVTLDLVSNLGACQEDPVSDIAGTITTPAGIGINAVDVLLEKADDGTEFSEVTDADGQYAFTSLPMYVKYTITPSKDGDIQNGLSTDDVLLIQKYIMDNSEFDSPYDVIASDLNGDGRVSATDLIFLQRIVIGMTTTLKDGIWKFVDASQQLTMENALSDFRNNFAIESLDQEMMSTDFIGIKMGDVNDDVNVSLRGDNSAPRSLSTSRITAVDREVRSGEIIELPLTFENFENLVGYQMTLETDGAVIKEITSGATPLYGSNIGYLSEDMTVISYADIRASLNDGQVFSIVMVAQRDGYLSEMIDVTNTYLNSYAYHSIDIEPSTILLEFTQEGEISGQLSVEQNTPNPFDLSTRIDFNIPSEEQVAIQVYDLTGKMAYQHTQVYQAGRNSITIKVQDIQGSNGVYYYRISSGNKSITRKMILIE